MAGCCTPAIRGVVGDLAHARWFDDPELARAARAADAAVIRLERALQTAAAGAQPRP